MYEVSFILAYKYFNWNQNAVQILLGNYKIFIDNSQMTYTHLPKVSGQNVDHINVHDVFICFTQKFTKTSKKTRLIFLSECSQKIRKNVFLLVLNAP